MKNYFSFSLALLLLVAYQVAPSYECAPQDKKPDPVIKDGKVINRRDTGFRELVGRNIYLFSYNYKATWDEALRFCRGKNMELMSLETQQENIWIKDYLAKNDLTETYWTSGSDVGRRKGDFIWTSTGERIREYDFAPDVSRKHHYIALSYNSDTMKYEWTTQNEHNEYSFICERETALQSIFH